MKPTTLQTAPPSDKSSQWYTTFSIGTPPQKFTALFDTGSPAFLVGGSNCTTCGTKALFDPSRSSSYVNSPAKHLNYLFSTGATSIPFSENQGATGSLVTDTVAWGGDLVVKSQQFVLCDTMAAALNAMPIDGIMGMALPDPEAGTDQSWYWNLVDSGQLGSPFVGFYIPPGDINGGEVTLGGYDESKYTGDLVWVDAAAVVSKLFGSYVLNQYAMYSNGTLLTNGTGSEAMPTGFAILDTGTAFMQTPDYQTAANIYAQISPLITQIDPAGAWGAPCDELDSVAPDLTFTLGSSAAPVVNVTIPREHFNLGEYPGLSGICQAIFNNPSDGIGGSWFFQNKAEWLVGSPLLNKYYTVWDGQGLKIGWGQLEGGPGF